MTKEPENSAVDRVHVELDWHDGPRAGIADLFGQPHRFESVYDSALGQYSDYLLVPIDQETLRLELEQQAIFLRWQEAFGAGLTTAESHPSRGGNPRWDELETLLAQRRTIDSAVARRAKATVVPLSSDGDPSVGPGYSIRWLLLSQLPPAP